MSTDRAAAIALLEAEHTFPGTFQFRVVVHAAARDAVVAALTAAGELGEVTDRPSRGGKYLSLRVPLQLQSAEQVLDVYALLGDLDGVLMIL